MPADITKNSDIYLMLGIAAPPTADQVNLITMIRKGVEAAVRNECHWQITETEFTSYLPEYLKPTSPTVGTANQYSGYALAGSFPLFSRGRNRLQLPAPFVKSVDSVYVDSAAKAGINPADFPVTSLLNPETDYYLEIDNGTWSQSGGLIRIAQSWPGTSGTIKITFTSGFSAEDLAGDFNDLNLAIISECAAKYIGRQRFANPGTAGDIKSKKLGDYAVTLHGVDGDEFSIGGGLSDKLKDYLNLGGYLFYNIGA